MSGKDIRAGGAFIEIFFKKKENSGAVVDDLKGELQGKLQTISRVAGGIGTALAGASATVLGPLGAAFASFLHQGDGLTDMADRIGITTDRLQELAFAASQSGASMED